MSVCRGISGKRQQLHHDNLTEGFDNCEREMRVYWVNDSWRNDKSSTTAAKTNKTHYAVANWVGRVCQTLTNGTFERRNARHKFNKLWQIRQCLPKVCYERAQLFLCSSRVNWKSRLKPQPETFFVFCFRHFRLSWGSSYGLKWKRKWKCYFINYTCPLQVFPRFPSHPDALV